MTFFAYIGPGAGFAFLGSFLALIGSFVLTFVSLAMWPFRMTWRLIRRRRGFKKASVKRLIFLGLDGLDPRLTEQYMDRGLLPNLARLREEGTFRRLRTTFPALSPVAWSTFATGVSPARHNIFDFLNRNMKTYVPELAAARVHQPRRVVKLGHWRIPVSRPYVEMRRKSRPFWSLLGERNIASTVIRVPITFPPDKFNGRQLSAMCTPDLRGTQGSFSQFTTRLHEATFEGGSRYPLERHGDHFEGLLEGPEDSIVEGAKPLAIPFRIVLDDASKPPALHIREHRVELRPGVYTPWLRLTFSGPLATRVHGIAKFMLTETSPDVTLYVSPVQIDPEKPALPISHPPYYAAYLAKLLGLYSTLGMAEDTWALNEGVIDDAQFLDQAYQLLDERESMFRNALEKTPRGVVACVVDTSDRVQHMFFRTLDDRGNGDHSVIEDLYRRMDRLVGIAMSHCDNRTALFVLSDHGFCSFRRGVNLNAWLLQNGYLTLKGGLSESGPYFKGVDWSRTRAYTMGLGGLYLNLKGREAQGIVNEGADAATLKKELVGKLTGLRDDDLGATAIREAYATDTLYKGPYLTEAPDLIVGYNEGYRASWDAAVGKVVAHVFEDNSKAWSGDHCVDPVLVPGVLFSNLKLDTPDPGIEDMAPTALRLFGVDPPAWMEGKPLAVAQ